MKKQVDKSHYEFNRYMDKARWVSVWHQLEEVLAFEPESVFEIGPGSGVFKAVLSRFGHNVKTLDLDPELYPDYVASADSMPFDDNTFDVVCAFQMLEHVPYEISLKIFKEMVRVASKGVVISLPDAAVRWPFSFYIPGKGVQWVSITRPRFRLAQHRFDGEHHWEINKAGYPLSRILKDLQDCTPARLSRSYRVNENPYHRFLIFNK